MGFAVCRDLFNFAGETMTGSYLSDLGIDSVASGYGRIPGQDEHCVNIRHNSDYGE